MNNNNGNSYMYYGRKILQNISYVDHTHPIESHDNYSSESKGQHNCVTRIT